MCERERVMEGGQSRDEGEREREIRLLTAQTEQKLYWLKYFFNNNSVENFLVAVDNI